MMDLGLGGPVCVGRVEGANHPGNCTDGVYGCHRCYNNANEGKGTFDTCEWCKKQAHLKLLTDHEEQCIYAVCESCRKKHQERIEREYEEEVARMPWTED